MHGDGLTSLQFRRTKGAVTEQVEIGRDKGADVVQLERKGNTYTMSAARFGEPFTSAQVTDLALGDEVYVGLFLCSHNPDVVERAVFRNVRIIRPAKDGFVPYRDYIGSHLEILDVRQRPPPDRPRLAPSRSRRPTGRRTAARSIYNTSGRVGGPRPAVPLRPRDAAADAHRHRHSTNRNNNDHVLSFDGTHARHQRPERRRAASRRSTRCR